MPGNAHVRFGGPGRGDGPVERPTPRSDPIPTSASETARSAGAGVEQGTFGWEGTGLGGRKSRVPSGDALDTEGSVTDAGRWRLTNQRALECAAGTEQNGHYHLPWLTKQPGQAAAPIRRYAL